MGRVILPEDIMDIKLIDMCISLLRHNIISVRIDGEKPIMLYAILVALLGTSKKSRTETFKEFKKAMFKYMRATDGSPYGYANPDNNKHIQFLERTTDLGMDMLVASINEVRAEGRYFSYNELVLLTLKLHYSERLRVGVTAFKNAVDAINKFADAAGKSFAKITKSLEGNQVLKNQFILTHKAESGADVVKDLINE